MYEPLDQISIFTLKKPQTNKRQEGAECEIESVNIIDEYFKLINICVVATNISNMLLLLLLLLAQEHKMPFYP